MEKSRLIAWVFVGLGVLTLGYGVNLLRAAQQSASWIMAEGQVEEVNVDVSTTTRKRSSSNSSNQRRKKIRYYVTLAYSYEVDGQIYQASRYAFGQGNRVSEKYKTREEAQQAARTYAPGDPLAVYYNPSDPSEAVIQAGITRATWLPLVFGLLFIGLGLFLHLGKEKG